MKNFLENYKPSIYIPKVNIVPLILRDELSEQYLNPSCLPKMNKNLNQLLDIRK